MELGCVSQSGMFYDSVLAKDLVYLYCTSDKLPSWDPAFEFEDFAGPGENSKRNCELLIQPKNNMYNLSYRALTLWNDEGYSPQEAFRLALTDSENWVEEVGRGL